MSEQRHDVAFHLCLRGDLAVKLDAIAAALGAVREAHRDTMSAEAWRLLGEAQARIVEAMLAKPADDGVDAAFAAFRAAEEIARTSGERWRAAVARQVAAGTALHGSGASGGRIGVVCAVVAAFHGLAEAELRGEERFYRVAHPRQEAMALARELTEVTFQQVADFFGRHVDTVEFAVKAVAARAETSRRYAAQLAQVRALCEAALKG